MRWKWWKRKPKPVPRIGMVFLAVEAAHLLRVLGEDLKQEDQAEEYRARGKLLMERLLQYVEILTRIEHSTPAPATEEKKER